MEELERIQDRIKRLERQVADLRLNMHLYPRGSRDWMRIQKTKKRLEEDISHLKAMLTNQADASA